MRYLLILAIVALALPVGAKERAKKGACYQAETAYYCKYKIGDESGEVKWRGKAKPSTNDINAALLKIEDRHEKEKKVKEATNETP